MAFEIFLQTTIDSLSPRHPHYRSVHWVKVKNPKAAGQ
jgi:hypothetical protein